MATKDEFEKHVMDEGESILQNHETDMNNIIASNQAAQDKALGLLGVKDDGTIAEGSITDRLMDVQNANTDFAIQQIENQKEKAGEEYAKEQGAAYADYQKQIDPYGVNAEQMAANGLRNTGYAESSKVAMYNQYQTRITAARTSYQQAIKDYDMAITQARLQNSSVLAQIAVDALKQRMEYIIQFSAQNTSLLSSLAQQKTAIRQQNLSNYMSVYNMLNQQSNEAYTKFDDQSNTNTSNNTSNKKDDNALYFGPFVIEQAEKKQFTSVSDVNDFFKYNKIDTTQLEMPLISKNQWKKAKRKGQQGYEYAYNSYEDYLNAYVVAALRALYEEG